MTSRRALAARLDDHAALHKQNIIDGPELAKRWWRRSGPELVCHLAAQIDVRASVACPADDAQVNVVGTVNVLEAARRVGARLVFCFDRRRHLWPGGADPCPWRTWCRCPSPRMASPSSVPSSTSACTTACTALTHAVLRFANVYGPRQDPTGEAGVIAIFCSRALEGKGADRLR